ncbi:hypothetical protein [Aestuariicoccus sp. MJ-SS9]|uniref:hypothetical protein n=1 Tax=Aestuariicoccus sp. MJ-SS9 TaxID=3079855 RepID=UPI002910B7FB|nr:hypothetical protein [Aestuariicoccus sp. MJ-SS9]MDU8910537.1 hypothetical protein [Aestuariicoccus sp. MJ-SS9]
MKAAILALFVAVPAQAQAPLPEFATCLDIENARFERALRRDVAAGVAAFEAGDVTGAEYCGTVGIVRCDRSAAPYDCQHALAAEQDALANAVRALLPAPEGDPLYQALWALARDVSAGPDCAGQNEAFTAWCAAREANRRLMSVVLAWQSARYLGRVPPATEAGWADAPPPRRPVARPLAGRD